MFYYREFQYFYWWYFWKGHQYSSFSHSSSSSHTWIGKDIWRSIEIVLLDIHSFPPWVKIYQIVVETIINYSQMRMIEYIRDQLLIFRTDKLSISSLRLCKHIFKKKISFRFDSFYKRNIVHSNKYLYK